jgi:hypothetical protein
MALSDELTKLANQAKKMEDEAKKAADEARSELQAHVQQASEAASRKAEELSGKIQESKAQASDRWTQVRSDWARHVSKVREDIAAQKAKDDAAGAQFAAELAEADAYDAIDFASAALDEAEYAVLDAILARKEADELAASR